MMELIGKRPDLLASFITPELKDIYGVKGLEGILEEYQIVSVPVKINNSYWDNSLLNKNLDLPKTATKETSAGTSSEFSTALGYSVTNGG